MSRYLGIASVQRQGFEGNTKANLDEIEGYVRGIAAAYPWIDLIVFPEASVHGVTHDLTENAESVPGPSTQLLAKLAKETQKWIIPGSMFELFEEKVYNTMPVFSPEGELVNRYRKMNPFSPAEASTPGNRIEVVDLPGIGRLGLCICFDMWFPEMTRSLIAMGAEVIIHPSLTPSTVTAQERIVRMSTAIVNQAYVVGTSVCGMHAGFTCSGHSMIVDPEGTVLQEAGDFPAVQLEMLDLDKVSLVRNIGLKGTCPILKHLNDNEHKWPVYGNQKASSDYLSKFTDAGKVPTSVREDFTV